MDVLKDNTTAWQSEQVAGQAHQPASKLVTIWAQGRLRITPWAYPRLRALVAARLTVAVFLAALGAVMLSYGLGGFAAIPLAGAALHLAIAYLDSAVARSAAPRT